MTFTPGKITKEHVLKMENLCNTIICKKQNTLL